MRANESSWLHAAPDGWPAGVLSLHSADAILASESETLQRKTAIPIHETTDTISENIVVTSPFVE